MLHDLLGVEFLGRLLESVLFSGGSFLSYRVPSIGLVTGRTGVTSFQWGKAMANLQKS